MFKFVVLCFLLWHEMCQFSSRAHPGSTDTLIPNLPAHVSPKINFTNVEFELRVIYNVINIMQIIQRPFHIISPSLKTTAPTTTSKPQIPLPNGYHTTIGFGSYKIHPEKLSWFDAWQVCIDEGGNLVVIQSDEEEKIVEKIARRSSDESFPWIGYYDLPGNGHWKSVLNESFIGWVHWMPGAPATDSSPLCAAYYVDSYRYGMLGTWCSVNRWFICKITTI